MSTYERVFAHVKPFYVLNGHALQNIENERTLRVAKEEIEKIREMQKEHSNALKAMYEECKKPLKD